MQHHVFFSDGSGMTSIHIISSYDEKWCFKFGFTKWLIIKNEFVLTSGSLMILATCATCTLENGSMIRQRFCSRRLSNSESRWARIMGSSSNSFVYLLFVWNYQIFTRKHSVKGFKYFFKMSTDLH